MSRRLALPLVAATLLLGGCDLLGIESAEQIAAKREAEGRAIGAGCRHAARAIEDCFALNKRADKAAMFAGWRDMNDYMRENNIESVAPTLSAQAARAEPVAEPAKADAEPAPKPRHRRDS